MGNMNSVICIRLNASPEQFKRLHALQAGFARLCNSVAPLVQQTGIWNRVALHHLSYKKLREDFPEMGSQMVCNAIYSVSRTCRSIFQSPASPFYLEKMQGKPLPLLRFTDNSPVYFDRHTLSLKKGVLSMFTLDGRMRFQLSLAPEVETQFKRQKLREIVLCLHSEGYELKFWLVDQEKAGQGDASEDAGIFSSLEPGEIPDYVMVDETVWSRSNEL